VRIIAGEFRGRKLKSVPGLDVRPTPDRLREALFNVLAPRIAGTVFLDAYAGSGAVGIEALSRGASRVILIERLAQALEIIRENLQSLGIRDKVTLVRGRASALLSVHPADIAFLDPPYDLIDEYAASLHALSTSHCPLAIAQHATCLQLEDRYGDLTKTRVLKQGDNSLSFFRPAAD
jgi:16S rRNA (guanine(966)-N(2))-methyltransferase RsmD